MKKKHEENFRILDEEELTEQERAALLDPMDRPKWRLRQRPLSSPTVPTLGHESSAAESP